MRTQKIIKLPTCGSLLVIASFIAGCDGGSAQVSQPVDSVEAVEAIEDVEVIEDVEAIEAVEAVEPVEAIEPVETIAAAEIPLIEALSVDIEWANSAALSKAQALPESPVQNTVQHNTMGRWGDLIDWPHIAAGAASLPSGNIASWASSDINDFRVNASYTHGSIYIPATGSFLDSPNTQHNLYGSSVAMAGDGSFLAVGDGRSVTSTSKLTDEGWSASDPTLHQRSFAQTTGLAGGQIITFYGADPDSPTEIWTTDAGWSPLTQPDSQSIPANGSTPLVVAPDGRLFSAGLDTELFSIDLENQPDYQSHGTHDANDVKRLYGTSVLFDEGKLLVAGGGRPSLDSALTIDINGATPVIETTSPMHNPRSMHNTVLLPDGQVMVVGGTRSGIPFSDDGSILEPELWDSTTGQWQKLAAHSQPRNYQSTALLLKDARVITMGGGLCGECTGNNLNAEIFEPPYLFASNGELAAIRPEINNAPDTSAAGEKLIIEASGTNTPITRFNLLRLNAVTRHHSTDQRIISLGFSETANGQYELQLPDNRNILLAGYYWLFALDEQGTPSVGHTLQVVDTEATVQPDTEEIPDLPDGSLFKRGDVLALHYDVAADIDDIHAIASGRTITSFFNIEPAVVVGTYGFDNNRRETYHVIFNGLTRKVAANEVATRSYGAGGYLDTQGYQAELQLAAVAQAAIWKQALDAGNDIWVAEGGPSDFTEEVLQQLLSQGITTETTRSKIHVIQHSIAANEGNTNDNNLAFVKLNTDYITIANGNQPNTTADLNTGVAVDDDFRTWAAGSTNASGWEFSLDYFAEKLDFSDTVELLYILNIGTDEIADTVDFTSYFD